MKRRHALLLSVLWVGGLVALDAWLVFQPANIRTLVDGALADTFACEYRYEDIEVTSGGTVVLHGLELMRTDDPTQLLVRLQELRLSIDLASAARLAPRIGMIELIEPELALSWDAGGRITIPSPFRVDDTPSPSEVPRVVVRGLDLWLRDSPYLTRPDVHFDLDELTVEMLPAVSEDWLYSFSLSLEDDILGNISSRGRFSEVDYDVHIEHEGFLVSEGMIELLTPEVGSFLAKVELSDAVRMRARFFENRESDRAVFEFITSFDGVDVAYDDFPQKVKGLTGEIRYADGRFETEALTGQLEGGSLEASGFFDLSDTVSPLNIRGSVHGLELTDDFVGRLRRLPHPGGVAAEQLERFRVRGPIDIDFTVTQERGRDPRPYLEIALRGCDFEFKGAEVEPGGERRGFHYPVHGVEGLVRLDDRGLSFDRITGRRGNLSVRARGMVDYRPGRRDSWDVNIGVSAIKIDEDMLAALDADTRATLKTLNAEGYVDADIHVYRRVEDEVEPPPEIEVDLGGVSLRYDGFPLALDDVRGRVRVEGDAVNVGPLTARHGDGEFVVSGRIGIGDKSGQIQLNLRAESLALHEDLYRALEVPLPDTAAELRKLRASGKVEVNMRLRQTHPETGIVTRGGITLLGVDFSPVEPAVTVTEVDGILEVDGDDLRILRGMTGRFAGERFNITGSFPANRGFHLKLEAADFALDDEFLTALEGVIPELKDPSNRPRLKGRSSAVLRIADVEGKVVIDSSVSIKEMRFQFAHWPEDIWLDDVTCELRARQGVVKIKDLVASLEPPARVADSGTGERITGSAPFDAGRKLEVHAESMTLRGGKKGLDVSVGGFRLFELPLAPWVFELLHEEGAAAARQLPAMTALIDVNVSSARFRSQEVLLTGGILRISGLHLAGDAGLYLESGTIEEFGAVISPENIRLEGGLVGRNLRLAGVLFPKMKGRFTGGRDGFLVREIEADVFGYAQGDTKRPLGLLDPEGSAASLNWTQDSFDIQAQLKGVRLAQTITALGGHPGNVRGRLNARMSLGGRLGRPETWTGGGRVDADAHNLVALPLFLNIIKALDITSLLTSSSRTRIGIDFEVKDRQIDLKQAELRSSTLDLSGGGTITFGGIIHARLEAKHKGGIPLVSDILSMVPSLLLSGVVIEGPLEDPKVTARSLGMGSDDAPLPHGRRPRVKPLKKDG